MAAVLHLWSRTIFNCPFETSSSYNGDVLWQLPRILVAPQYETALEGLDKLFVEYLDIARVDPRCWSTLANSLVMVGGRTLSISLHNPYEIDEIKVLLVW